MNGIVYIKILRIKQIHMYAYTNRLKTKYIAPTSQLCTGTHRNRLGQTSKARIPFIIFFALALCLLAFICFYLDYYSSTKEKKNVFIFSSSLFLSIDATATFSLLCFSIFHIFAVCCVVFICCRCALQSALAIKIMCNPKRAYNDGYIG